MKPKVFHLVDSAGMYGAEKVILTLLEELRDSEYSGTLGCIRERTDEVPEIARQAKELGIPVVFFTMRRGFDPRGARTLKRFLRNNRALIAHSHGYKPDIYLSLVCPKRVKTVSTVHGWARQTAGLKGRIYEFLDARSLRRIDAVVAVSKAVVKTIKARGVPGEKISLIYNGIRIRPPRPPADVVKLREKYGVPPDAFVLGTVGRLAKVKGQAYLVHAMTTIVKKIENCRLLIAGDGPLKSDLSRQIKELNLENHVKLLGYVNDIDEFLSIINIFVLPSLSEGLPIALLEAMAQGKPVVASTAGGITEVVRKDVDGILIPPGNDASIVEAVENLFSDQGLLQRLGSQGKEEVQRRFSSTAMAEQYSLLYSTLVPC